MKTKRILIIGAGAAGYFSAITAAENNPEAEIVIAEAGSKPLRKVEISGGGRCNVTQACFEIAKLVEAYPRGRKELRGPFSRFQPKDTIEWFETSGVELKVEEDGRVFPVTDSSKTIIDCFESRRLELGVRLWLRAKVLSVVKLENQFDVEIESKNKSRKETFDSVILTSGSSKAGYKIARELGHNIVFCVPSLFTFEVNDKRLSELSGVSVDSAELKLVLDGQKPLLEKGPLLITHWGFSGPAVIRLSAWGARLLEEKGYLGELQVNWLPDVKIETFASAIKQAKQDSAKKIVIKNPSLSLPKRLWESLCIASSIGEDLRYAELSKKQIASLTREVFEGAYQISGKGVFKEEFVTCGGVSLKEVDFQNMQSKLVPGLHFAGEVLDIDGITGGYNFQSAWTTAYIAGESI